MYKDLFEYSTGYREVATFLAEIIINVMPKDFVEGKNKKILNKKIL